VNRERLPLRELVVPLLAALLVAQFVLYAVGFDQGTLAAPMTQALADKGGVLHEFFHDARHLLGVPCH
jgi:hypothetical protein